MKSYIFKVVIESDQFPDGKEAFHAYCPALQGCRTWGYTYEETVQKIKEAIHGYIEDLIKAGDPIPVDPKGSVVEVREELVVAVNV